jgi:hypothetical protein
MNFNQGGYPIFGNNGPFIILILPIYQWNTIMTPKGVSYLRRFVCRYELLKTQKGRLVRSQIVKDHIYPLAILVDLNSDGFADILAYNLIENKLEFFYNNSNGKFALVKQTPVSGKVNHLYAYNIIRTSSRIYFFPSETTSTFYLEILLII